MLHPGPSRCAALFLIGGLTLVAGTAACSGGIEPTVLAPTTFAITTLPSIDEILSDKTLGSASAPNQIIEYVSFANAASAAFHLQILPQLKTQYADTQRAQIAFRNLFVVNETVNAALLARCAGNARFFDAADTIFRSQATWATASNPDTAVGQVMLGFGMSPSVQTACTGNTTLQAGVVKIFQDALTATYLLPDGTQRVPGPGGNSIVAVPAIIVNGVLLDGTNAADGSPNPVFAPTLANIQQFLK